MLALLSMARQNLHRMVDEALDLQISRIVDGDTDSAGFALVDHVDAAGLPEGDGFRLQPFGSREVGMRSDDDLRMNGMEKGIAQTGVAVVAAGDDHIGRDIGVGGEYFRFGADASITGEEQFPAVPVEAINHDPLIGTGVLGLGAGDVEDFETRAVWKLHFGKIRRMPGLDPRERRAVEP